MFFSQFHDFVESGFTFRFLDRDITDMIRSAPKEFQDRVNTPDNVGPLFIVLTLSSSRSRAACGGSSGMFGHDVRES